MSTIRQVMYLFLSLVALACGDNDTQAPKDTAMANPYVPVHRSFDGLDPHGGASGAGNAYERFNYESDNIVVRSSDLDGPAGAPPFSLWKTSRRWQGIDVYVKSRFRGALNLPYYSFGVYAIGNGTRTLVATGRFRGNGADDTQAATQTKVISYRGIADVFEVVMQREGASSLPEWDNAVVCLVASDNANDAEDDATNGVQQAGGVGGALGTLTTSPNVTIGNSASLLPVTPVAIHAVNAAAAMRYIQLAETSGGTTIASFACPANDSLVVTDPAILKRMSRAALFARPSSTPVAFTVVNDISYGMWAR